MALAWQLIYAKLLPASYPDKASLLSFYQRGLSPSQIAEAAARADWLQNKHDLHQVLSEDELAQAYAVRDDVDVWDKLNPDVPSKAIYARFNDWLQWLASRGKADLAQALDDQADQLHRQKKFPIVYGQILVQGPESVSQVQSNISFLPEGYFVTQAVAPTLVFTLPGYQTVTVPVNPAAVQGIGPVVMIKRAHSRRTGVVGRVRPWGGLEKGHIILTLDETHDIKQPDPWYHPVVPLTVTPGGEFYATGLVAGPYHLYITTAGMSTSIKFTAKSGEIRGLSLINLRARTR